jgi:hypothetical protein
MGKNSLLALLLIATFIVMSPYAHGQWIQTNGPYYSFITCFAAVDSFILASSNGTTLYRSANNGNNWTDNSVAGVYPIFSLANSGTKIFAGGERGISLSTNNGTTWTLILRLMSVYTSGIVYALAVSDSDIFAGVDAAAGVGEIYLSTDNGISWKNASAGINFGKISSFAVISNGAGGNDVFAGADRGVYLSTNTGTSWIAVNNGLTDSAVTSLAVIGTNLFAGTRGGVFASANYGTTWSSVNSGLTSNEISSLAVSGTDIFAGTWNQGVFLSEDYGMTWTSVDNGLHENGVNALACIGAYVYAGTMDDGIYCSTDNGAIWNAVNSGATEIPPIRSLSAIGSNVFAATDYYLYASSHDGLDWIPALDGARVLTAGNSTVYTTDDSGICISSNQGISWTTTLNSGFPNFELPVALTAIGRNIFLATAPVDDLDTKAGIYLSTNNGVSWSLTQVNTPFVSDLATNRENAYAIIGGSLWVSPDIGSTWQRDSIPPYASPPYISSLAFRDSEMFIGTSSGVLRSTEKGSQWEYIDSGLPRSINGLAVHGTTVFAGTTVGVYFLNSGDTSWRAVNTGLPSTSNSVSSIVADDSDLYAALGQSVWRRPISEMITAVKTLPSSKPFTFLLFQNYPNPFNPTTVISYQLPTNGFMRLEIYDVLGRKIKTLVSERQSAGAHSVTFNAGGLSSGVYFYRLTAGSFPNQSLKSRGA